MTTTTTRRSRRAEPRRGLQARTRWSNRSPHGDSSFDAMPFQARPWVPPAHDQLAGRPYDARTGPGLGRFDERPTVPDRDRRVGKLRSEEHTSELQSRGHLVCRLLLVKKKKRRIYRVQCRRRDSWII